MEIEPIDIAFDLKDIKMREIEEALEDPFIVRILPELERSDGESRFFALGRTVADRPLFLCFWTNGRNFRIISAREMTESEQRFYDRNYASLK